MFLHIGIDDTDSPTGGCTTYIAALLVEKLLKSGFTFIDYPNLLRLNPNVPWKTRGNGAICLRIAIDENKIKKVKDHVLELVEEYAEFDCVNTNPGVVFLRGNVPALMEDFSNKVVSQVVSLNEALKVIEASDGEAIGFKNKRGLIGATAAVGGLSKGDYTFELLTYRIKENLGTQRKLDEKSVWIMDDKVKGTFNNVDYEFKRILIAPHGPDPVLFGIRGETPESVYKAGKMISINEQVERWSIFRSNQGTDAHLRTLSRINDVRPLNPVIVSGHVLEKPRIISGGHVIFKMSDETGSVDCAAYEPTGSFRKVALQLLVDDGITAYGGVRKNKNRLTVNLEKLRVNTLTTNVRLVNPRCPSCSGSMESMGREKGYRCRRCGYRDSKLRKVKMTVERDLKVSLYVPPLGAQRHLTKPKDRFGKEKKGPYSFGHLLEPWFGLGDISSV